MADKTSAPPEWHAVSDLMVTMHKKLPVGWNHGNEFWLVAIKNLAEAVVEMRATGVAYQHAANLIGVGGMIFAQLLAETDADELAADLLARIRRGGI